MPKSRAKDQKRLRQRRKEAGLVEFRCWCTPIQKWYLEGMINNCTKLQGLLHNTK